MTTKLESQDNIPSAFTRIRKTKDAPPSEPRAPTPSSSNCNFRGSLCEPEIDLQEGLQSAREVNGRTSAASLNSNSPVNDKSLMIRCTIYHELDGMLVIGLSYNGKNYIGSLLDTDKYKYSAPIRRNTVGQNASVTAVGSLGGPAGGKSGKNSKNKRSASESQSDKVDKNEKENFEKDGGPPSCTSQGGGGEVGAAGLNGRSGSAASAAAGSHTPSQTGKKRPHQSTLYLSEDINYDSNSNNNSDADISSTSNLNNSTRKTKNRALRSNTNTPLGSLSHQSHKPTERTTRRSQLAAQAGKEIERAQERERQERQRRQSLSKSTASGRNSKCGTPVLGDKEAQSRSGSSAEKEEGARLSAGKSTATPDKKKAPGNLPKGDEESSERKKKKRKITSSLALEEPPPQQQQEQQEQQGQPHPQQSKPMPPLHRAPNSKELREEVEKQINPATSTAEPTSRLSVPVAGKSPQKLLHAQNKKQSSQVTLLGSPQKQQQMSGKQTDRTAPGQSSQSSLNGSVGSAVSASARDSLSSSAGPLLSTLGPVAIPPPPKLVERPSHSNNLAVPTAIKPELIGNKKVNRHLMQTSQLSGHPVRPGHPAISQHPSQSSIASSHSGHLGFSSSHGHGHGHASHAHALGNNSSSNDLHNLTSFSQQSNSPHSHSNHSERFDQLPQSSPDSPHGGLVGALGEPLGHSQHAQHSQHSAIYQQSSHAHISHSNHSLHPSSSTSFNSHLSHQLAPLPPQISTSLSLPLSAHNNSHNINSSTVHSSVGNAHNAHIPRLHQQSFPSAVRNSVLQRPLQNSLTSNHNYTTLSAGSERSTVPALPTGSTPPATLQNSSINLNEKDTSQIGKIGQIGQIGQLNQNNDMAVSAAGNLSNHSNVQINSGPHSGKFLPTQKGIRPGINNRHLQNSSFRPNAPRERKNGFPVGYQKNF